MGTNFTDFATTDRVNAATFNDRFDEMDAALEARLKADGSVAGATSQDQLFTNDIRPQSSVNGLNARFERLFGDDVPGAAYSFTKRQFGVTSGNVAEFEDAQSSPYTFAGGSPFSVNVPASTFANSNQSDYPGTVNHFLRMTTLVANPDLYLQWTSASALDEVAVSLSIGPYLASTTDDLLAELRVWAVEAASVSASSGWWAIRWTWQPATFPQWPLRVQLWYSTAAGGDGLTFAIDTGTPVGSTIPVVPGQIDIYKLLIYTNPAPVGSFDIYNADGMHGGNIAGIAASTPTSIKTARFYVKQQYASFFIDRMEAL